MVMDRVVNMPLEEQLPEAGVNIGGGAPVEEEVLAEVAEREGVVGLENGTPVAGAMEAKRVELPFEERKGPVVGKEQAVGKLGPIPNPSPLVHFWDHELKKQSLHFS